MVRIRFPTRIAHATDSEKSKRYALQGTLVTPDGFAVATDGRIAACTKVNVDGLELPAMIPQALGPATKSDLSARYVTRGDNCSKHTVVKGQERVQQARVTAGRFPSIGDIAGKVDPAACSVLAINARHLWRLAQSINVPDSGDVVVLLVPPADDDGVVARVLGVLANQESLHTEETGGFGMIMPCDAEAAAARSRFSQLRDAAVSSVDRAARLWSGQPLKDDAPPPTPQPKRRPRRKRRVA